MNSTVLMENAKNSCIFLPGFVWPCPLLWQVPTAFHGGLFEILPRKSGLLPDFGRQTWPRKKPYKDAKSMKNPEKHLF